MRATPFSFVDLAGPACSTPKRSRGLGPITCCCCICLTALAATVATAEGENPAAVEDLHGEVLPRGAVPRVLHLAEASFPERAPQLIRAKQSRPRAATRRRVLHVARRHHLPPPLTRGYQPPRPPRRPSPPSAATAAFSGIPRLGAASPTSFHSTAKKAGLLGLPSAHPGTARRRGTSRRRRIQSTHSTTSLATASLNDAAASHGPASTSPASSPVTMARPGCGRHGPS